MADDATAFLRGSLLVARPTLVDPNFNRTVVLIAEHSADGAMGIVLNRPTEALVTDVVPVLAEFVDEDAPVYEGGPVQPEAVVALAEFADAADAAVLAFDRVGFLPAEVDVEASATVRARVFAGYAGWGPGQLEGELAAEAWIVDPAQLTDVFETPAGDLWRSVLRRKGGDFAILALMPEDPAQN